MKKKGQAAMEFLMTYGWAILAAIIAIGVLAYFGVFTPGKYTTGTAVVTPPFYVNAWNVKPAGVTLEIKNNGGETYDIGNISVTNCASDNTGWAGVAAGASQTVTIACTTAPVVGENFKGDITISYQKVGSAVDLTSTGTIAEKVTA
jgi:uncharacterized protein (UPF0333 family)